MAEFSQDIFISRKKYLISYSNTRADLSFLQTYISHIFYIKTSVYLILFFFIAHNYKQKLTMHERSTLVFLFVLVNTLIFSTDKWTNNPLTKFYLFQNTHTRTSLLIICACTLMVYKPANKPITNITNNCTFSSLKKHTNLSSLLSK